MAATVSVPTAKAIATRSSEKVAFTLSHQALSRSVIRWPDRGSDFSHCIKNPNTLAFTYVGFSKIYFCRKVFKESWYKNEQLAQTMIHEGVHVKGHRDECYATKIEVAAMRQSGQGVAFKNSYWGRCKTQ